ncbi:hypothetical protein [Metabacillus litoralis]|nr:hypothetical protein [Metabacillus litoralis]
MVLDLVPGDRDYRRFFEFIGDFSDLSSILGIYLRFSGFIFD